MRLPAPQLYNRLEIHDRKQFEIKLEYEPCITDAKSRYLVEAFLFLPASLNVDADTYPRQDFYADIHNYVRLKTPVFSLEEILAADSTPLLRLERYLTENAAVPESEIIYQAKLLSCIFRGALRRFVTSAGSACEDLRTELIDSGLQAGFASEVRAAMSGIVQMLERFRDFTKSFLSRPSPEERTRASLRLVDEYMSLSVEQLVRKAVTKMDQLPKSGFYDQLRREMMAVVIREENYRKENKLRSVLSPTGDNEEYMQRVGFLKKFCTNILFLAARHEHRYGWEQLLFAIAAGLAMAFATAVAFWAQGRFPQASLNFFLIIVIGYMLKDRIKEGLGRIMASVVQKRLFDRATVITEPVTQKRLGVCREKVDYGTGSRVPEAISSLRRTDDFVTVSQGELAETVIHYQKQIVLASEFLPKDGGVSGVTDIIRLNIDRLLRDMDDPEYAVEYVDLEDFSVGRVRAAKRYQVDIAFRFSVDQGRRREVSLELARLVLDRDGIKRMMRFQPNTTSTGAPPSIRSVA